jgi:hypothetical protein
MLDSSGSCRVLCDAKLAFKSHTALSAAHIVSSAKALTIRIEAFDLFQVPLCTFGHAFASQLLWLSI